MKLIWLKFFTQGDDGFTWDSHLIFLFAITLVQALWPFSVKSSDSVIVGINFAEKYFHEGLGFKWESEMEYPSLKDLLEGLLMPLTADTSWREL